MRRMLAMGLLTVVACRPNDGPGPSAIRDLTVKAASDTITVSYTTRVTATAFDSDGEIIPHAPVQWSSVTPAILSVSSDGVVTGLQPGQGTVRGAAGGRSAGVTIQVIRQVVATLTFDRDSSVLTLPGGKLTLVPVAADAAGRAIVNPTLFFSVDAPRVASVTQLGVVTALAAGTAVVSGSGDGVTATMRVRVGTNGSANAPKITAVTALAAGGAAVITGTNFAPTVAGNAVLVEGVPATITAATTTQLNITLPAGGWACEPERPVFIQVNANNEIGVGTASLRAANLRTLAVGQSVVVSNASEVRCNQLAGTGGSYLVTVYNPARVMSGKEATFTLRGLPAGAAVATNAVASSTAATSRRAPRPAAIGYPAIGSPQFARAKALGVAQRSDEIHASVMERSLAFARAAGPAAWRRSRTLSEAATPAAGHAANQVATLGAITPLKIPNLDAQNFCTSNIPIGARTAWVGQRAIIVEDTTTLLNGQPTLKGQLDSLYAVIGQEFDAVMWPILTANFGNPLVYDDKLSKTGKIVMFFSPRINTMASGGVTGFVVSCDFFPVLQAPSSNLGEYFYAIMPTSSAGGLTSGTKGGWLRSMRATIIHEAKHITSFGERFDRNAEFEELWLEEGTARHAEELFARSIYGVPWKGNVGYQASVYCDVRPAAPISAPQCVGRPVLMLRHFDALYQYLQAPEPYSVLGRVAPTDNTFYATSWSIVRWMIDHYATSEAAFLSQLVQTGQFGVPNLEARAGKAWEEMFGEWALTMFTDDYPGVTFANARLRFPSWNLRDEFRGLCVDFGPCLNPANPQNVYPREFPLVPRPLSFGAFSETVNFLNAASFAAWTLSGTQAAPQLIEVRAVGGGEPPSQLRIAIVRVQ
ncbi:MAG: hypothetical protein AABZ29_07955 [Gemmatimonadota bacterium]